MKKFIRFSLVLCLTIVSITFSGCYLSGNNVVKGNSERVTREITLESELKGVRTMSVIDVILDPSLEGEIILEGDSNILDIVTAEQKSGGILELGFERNTSIMSVVNVKVYVPYINGGLLEVMSVGSITQKDDQVLAGDSFDLRISSTGNIELAIETKELTVNDASTGTIRLTGSADAADITLSSTGSFEGYDFKLGDAVITVSSTGSAYVNVSGDLEAMVSGTGSVIFDGDPKSIDARGGGLGTVRSR